VEALANSLILLSDRCGIIECMFEDDGSALVERIVLASRQENQAIARKFVAIGELFEIRRAEHGEEKDCAVDTWAEVSGEVSAALRCSAAMASSYMHYARTMHDRLRRVAAVFEAGDIDFETFAAIAYRTDLITEPELIAKADRQLALYSPRWGSLSRSRRAAKIDRVVRRVDKDALRVKREITDNRSVGFWLEGEGGLTRMSATMMTTDAKVLEARLEAMAATVCDADPRPEDARRVDALGALGDLQQRLSCQCGRPDCPAGGRIPTPAQVIIHVVAEQATVDGRGDTPGVSVADGELIPAQVVAELAREAKLRPIVHPADAPPEPRYTPSRALADFVRARDLTCRAPGCDRPAIECDLDHTVPYQDGGLTHASNIKCYCRFHHLLKTFWGWKDEQFTDGTVIFTLPGGQRYVTLPGSAVLFPELCAPTAELAIPDPKRMQRCGDRKAMMPRRKTTRAQNRARYVETERARGRTIREARRKARGDAFAKHFSGAGPPPSDEDDDPPPF
jgi:hypothetical protein